MYPGVADGFEPPPEHGHENMVYTKGAGPCCMCPEDTHWIDTAWGYPIRTCSPDCREAIWKKYEESLKGGYSIEVVESPFFTEEPGHGRS